MTDATHPQGFQLPEELRLIGQTVRDYIQQEILPLEREELDYDAIFLPREHYERLTRITKSMGLWCPGVPERFGGAGLSCFGLVVFTEEVVQHRAGLYCPAYFTFGEAPPEPLLEYATPYQVEEYVLPTVRGEKKGWYAITEPSGGSDPARAIRTTAVRDGDDWILNGSKIFITGALWGDYGLVFARTDLSSRRGITAFIVENRWPGVSVQPVPVIRPYTPAQVFFDNVRVPDRNRVGEVNGGWYLLADRLLARHRIPYSAANLGVAVAAHRLACEYVHQRETFGAPLATRQAIQWMLVDNEIDIRAGRWLTWEASWKFDAGEPFRMEASIAKLFTSEALARVVDRCIQIYGGYGVSKWLPFERWYREARIRRIGEGPSEIQRIVIARELLGISRST